LKLKFLIAFLWILIPAFASAEAPPTDTPEAASNMITNKLSAKLIDSSGKKIPIGIIQPLNYTTGPNEQLTDKLIIKSFSYYGSFDVRPISDTLRALSLEEFRRIVARHNYTVVIATVLKPTNFDVFLFDRRTPYFIYAYSAAFPESLQYKLTQTVIEEFTKVIVRRILFAYVQNEYYELPRADTPPVLQTEIPRWIASTRTLTTINHDIVSNYYGTLGVGGAVSMGSDGVGSYSSNMVGFELGRRIFDHIFLEASLDLFTWDALGASIKYLSNDRGSIFNYSLGLGAAVASNSHTLADNPNLPLTISGNCVMASGTVLFPIHEVNFKLEGKVFLGLMGGLVFAMAPGFSIAF
jgi:hypothetical protein